MSYTYDSESQKNLTQAKCSILWTLPYQSQTPKTPPHSFWFISDLEIDKVIRKISKWPKKVKMDHFVFMVRWPGSGPDIFGPNRGPNFWKITEFRKIHFLLIKISCKNHGNHGNYNNFHHLLEMSHHSMSHFPFRWVITAPFFNFSSSRLELFKKIKKIKK